MTPEDIKKCKKALNSIQKNSKDYKDVFAIETALKVLDEWEALKPICAGTPKRIAELEQDLACMKDTLGLIKTRCELYHPIVGEHFYRLCWRLYHL